MASQDLSSSVVMTSASAGDAPVVPLFDITGLAALLGAGRPWGIGISIFMGIEPVHRTTKKSLSLCGGLYPVLVKYL